MSFTKDRGFRLEYLKLPCVLISCFRVIIDRLAVLLDVFYLFIFHKCSSFPDQIKQNTGRLNVMMLTVGKSI